MKIEKWIENNLIATDDDYPVLELYKNWETRESKFGVETVLYSTELHGNFVQSIIHGTRPSDGFDYAKMMKTIGKNTWNVNCDWVYIAEPDNALAVIESVKAHSWKYTEWDQEGQLTAFQTNPADEGGCSHLCLIPEDRTWLLSHEYNPGNDFTVSMHATEEFSETLLSALEFRPALDVR